MNHNKWYLTQRLGLRSSPNSSKLGVDALVTHDYMGSSEFEYGAVPDAWRKLREDSTKMTVYATPFVSRQGKPFSVVLPTSMSRDDRDDVFTDLWNLRIESDATKEPTYMDYAVDAAIPGDYRDATVAWITLGPEPMFWSMCETLTRNILAELQRGTGRPEQFSLYDNAEFYHAGKRWIGQVRGIYESHMRIRLQNGNEQRVPYESVVGPA